MASKAVRDLKNRNENTIRGNEVVGGVRIDATKYCTGRTDVRTMQLIPSTAEQAKFVFGE